MKSAVETLNPTRVKLTVEVPFDELKPSLDAAYKSIAGQINVPGFRKGKVPPRVIDQRVGREAVVAEALNDALPRFYAQAADENKVRPLGQPEVEVTDTPSGVFCMSSATSRMSDVVTCVADEVRIRRAFAIRDASGVGIVTVCPRVIVGGADEIVGRGAPDSRYGGVKI